MGGFHTFVALAGPAYFSETSRRARVERKEEESEPLPSTLFRICKQRGSALLPSLLTSCWAS